MTAVERMTHELVRAHRTGNKLVLDSELNALTIAEAASVQVAVLSELGETVPASKVALNKLGQAVAAPLLGSRYVSSGASLPIGVTTGLEVEIAVRLSRDLTPELAARGEVGVLSAIGGFYVGIELIGSRIERHREAGPGPLLADNLVSAGYVLNESDPWQRGTDTVGAVVAVVIDGIPIHSGPANHPFGGLLVALQRYALDPTDLYGSCRAGHIITTGTLCGVIPVTKSCSISASVGGTHVVSVVLE
jgi:2-keto-4-pentenoate hydratase